MKKTDAPKIPNVSWRSGRPRFSPGPTIRAMGYRPEDLKHEDGRWFSAGEALDWSRSRSGEIAQKRDEALRQANRKRPKGAPKLTRIVKLYTIADLFEDWRRSPRWRDGLAEGRREIKPYSASTKRDYAWKIGALERHDPDLFHAAVEALDTTICFGLYEDLWGEHGLAVARGIVAVLSSAISWGLRRGKMRMQGNPARGLGMSTPEPTVRFGEREEIHALVEAADWMKRPELGDMIVLGLWTGQRQGDRLAMVQQSDELVRGRRLLRQSKTGAIVAVRQSPQLEARIAASRARRKAAGVEHAHVILNETSWEPFGGDHYRHLFQEVRAVAAAGVMIGETIEQVLERAGFRSGRGGRRKPAALPAGTNVSTLWRLKPCPSVSTFKEKSLRSTAVVMMGLGGSTTPEIVSVTGHTLVSANNILRHYLARHPEMADSAIAKMIAWYESGESPEIVRDKP